MNNWNKHIGSAGESIAALYYDSVGFKIEERNWECSEGELDIIVSKDDLIVFVEVKTRTTDKFGSGIDSVDQTKKTKILELSNIWLGEREEFYEEIRYDVALVDKKGDIEILQDFF